MFDPTQKLVDLLYPGSRIQKLEGLHLRKVRLWCMQPAPYRFGTTEHIQGVYIKYHQVVKRTGLSSRQLPVVTPSSQRSRIYPDYLGKFSRRRSKEVGQSVKPNDIKTLFYCRTKQVRVLHGLLNLQLEGNAHDLTSDKCPHDTRQMSSIAQSTTNLRAQREIRRKAQHSCTPKTPITRHRFRARSTNAEREAPRPDSNPAVGPTDTARTKI